MTYKHIAIFALLMFSQGLLIAQVDHWETVVYAENTWHFQLGTAEPPTSWKMLSFDDSQWSTGAGSIGYADGDDNTIIDITESLYMRKKFNVVDKSKIAQLVFHADYDDGFVAYLNGEEIARANLEGNPPPYNASTPDFREALMYQGGLPVTFYLDSIVLEDYLVEGENVLAIQTHNFEGLVSSDMTTLYWLSFGINDASNDYGPTPDWWIINEPFETPLPIVKIDTGGEYIPDEPSIEGVMGIIWNGVGVLNSSLDIPEEFLGNITIERRGQASQMYYPKNGYAIETKDSLWVEDMDVSFLNFPEEEDWVLHGPYADKSLIRNVVAMQMARNIGQYASRTRLVELLINDQYEGVYVLMERIKRDENRVDIAKLNPEDISGDELTGGYIIKCDKGETDWYSAYDMVNNPGQKLRFQYVAPKRSKIEPEQEAYIQSYIDSFEHAMYTPQIPYGGKYYYEYIDITSFADHFILQELTKNTDAYRISFYMSKDKDSNGGLLKATPVWDFNFAFGLADFCNSDTDFAWVYDEHCGIFNPFWWGNLMEEDAFANEVHCRWLEHKEGGLNLDTIFAFIDEKAALLEPVVDRNFQRWPVLDEYVWPNAYIPGTFQGEIEYLKDFLTIRMEWMNEHIIGSCGPVPVTSILEKNEIKVYPNPASKEVFIEVDLPEYGDLEVDIYDVLGKHMLSRKIPDVYEGKQVMKIDFLDIKRETNFYFIELKLEGKLLGRRYLVVGD